MTAKEIKSKAHEFAWNCINQYYESGSHVDYVDEKNLPKLEKEIKVILGRIAAKIDSQ